MLTQIKLMPCLSVLDPETLAVGINQTTKIMNDDVEITRTVENVIFEKGQIQELKSFLGVDESPEISYITQLWG